LTLITFRLTCWTDSIDTDTRRYSRPQYLPRAFAQVEQRHSADVCFGGYFRPRRSAYMTSLRPRVRSLAAHRRSTPEGHTSGAPACRYRRAARIGAGPLGLPNVHSWNSASMPSAQARSRDFRRRQNYTRFSRILSSPAGRFRDLRLELTDRRVCALSDALEPSECRRSKTC
jgi:hypothetical protein